MGHHESEVEHLMRQWKHPSRLGPTPNDPATNTLLIRALPTSRASRLLPEVGSAGQGLSTGDTDTAVTGISVSIGSAGAHTHNITGAPSLGTVAVASQGGTEARAESATVWREVKPLALVVVGSWHAIRGRELRSGVIGNSWRTCHHQTEWSSSSSLAVEQVRSALEQLGGPAR